jgi:DNA-directed RNA polymerase subunit M/transcription elongation factor TFIIS
MKFCENCSNYLFLKIKNDDQNVLFIYNCRNCGYTSKSTNTNVKSMKQESIYSNPGNIDKIRYYAIKKDLLKYDKTLPHINNISCSNKECISHSEPSKNDIIYIIIDKEKLQELFICINCSTHWTNK